MRQVWEPEDLLAAWTLVEADWELVANKSGATRLGFALLLKFFEIETRFPRAAEELPRAAVEYVARQVQVPAEQLTSYDWSGRSIKYHRVQIRETFGFREATRDDQVLLIAWLADEVCPVELHDERIREALWARCRLEQIEPPGRVDRMIGAARATFEERFCARTMARLSPASVDHLETLLVEADQTSQDGDPASVFTQLKEDPGRVSLETLLRETEKLHQLQAIGLPTGLFADASEKLLESWRARAASEYPAWMRRHPEPVRLTLLAALCWTRTVEIVDALAAQLAPTAPAPDLLTALCSRGTPETEAEFAEWLTDWKQEQHRRHQEYDRLMGLLYASVPVDQHPELRRILNDLADTQSDLRLMDAAREREVFFRHFPGLTPVMRLAWEHATVVGYGKEQDCTSADCADGNSSPY